MIGLTVDQAKGLFFDRDAVLSATNRAERNVFRTFGGTVRKIARRSIKKRKKASAPGQPPSSHVGLLKDKLFFMYEPVQHSVVIGPIRLRTRLTPEGKTVPQVLEEGGKQSLLFWNGRRFDRRPIEIAPRPYMKRAFDIALPEVPDMWRDSVRP